MLYEPGIVMRWEAASALQTVGFIRYRRGRSAGLEAAACECYHVVKAEIDRFFHS